MGFLSGSSTTKTETTPWAPQADALKSIFNSSADLFRSKSGSSWYDGDLYANMDPQTLQAIKSMQGYVDSTGQSNANTLTQAGTGAVNSGQAGFNSAMGTAQSMYSSDPTQANISAAGQYANNPYLSGAIDAASRDITRNLSENTLPSIDRAASSSGNINSSRAGIASGIAMRGAQDQIGDIASTMRSSAYNSGLNLAESARTANMGAAQGAAGLYGTSVGQGAGMIGSGNTMAMGNMQTGITNGQLMQQDQQGQLDADLNRWQQNDTRQQSLIDNYYGTVGANNWGGTSTQTASSSPSILSAVLGTISTGAGIAKSFANAGSRSASA